MENSNNLKKLYLWGLVGLIPNIGLIAGIILLWKGIAKYKDKTLVIIGLADIVFTFIFWSIYVPYSQKSHMFDEPNIETANSNLNTAVKNIEFYKYKFGKYPEKINLTSEKLEFIFDPFLIKNNKLQDLHYKRIRDKYTVFSVGIDRIPNTKDDIFPTITNGDTIKFGLIKSNSY